MSETLQDRVERLLWGDSPWARSRARRVARMPARFVYALARDLTEGQLTLRAMSLVYTTLLALVPLLAFAFSVMKGLGVHRDVEPLLMEFLQPLGAQAEVISSQIIGFVENVRGGLLGSIGLAVLIFTVISMIQKIEDTFNYIWQVQKSRSLARRFSDYLSVLLVGPLLMVTAIGLLATITSSTVIQRLVETRPLAAIVPLLGGIGSFSLVVAVFAFFYAFVPNTRVKVHAALVGAALAAGAWTLGGSVFAAVVVGSTRFAAIYSSFAIAIVGLIWLYLSWLILLLGAQIAFYVQYPGRLMLGRNELKLSIARMEQLALGIMQRVGDGFRSGQQPDFASLASTLDCPARSLENVTAPLEKAGLLLHTEKGKLVPGRDPDTIRLADILVAVRGEDPAGGDAAVSAIVEEMRTARMDRLAGRTLADLATASEHTASLSGDGHPPDQQ